MAQADEEVAWGSPFQAAGLAVFDSASRLVSWSRGRAVGIPLQSGTTRAVFQARVDAAGVSGVWEPLTDGGACWRFTGPTDGLLEQAAHVLTLIKSLIQ